MPDLPWLGVGSASRGPLVQMTTGTVPQKSLPEGRLGRTSCIVCLSQESPLLPSLLPRRKQTATQVVQHMLQDRIWGLILAKEKGASLSFLRGREKSLPTSCFSLLSLDRKDCTSDTGHAWTVLPASELLLCLASKEKR